MTDKSTLNVSWVSINRLYNSPANPRHNDEAVGPVADSLRRFGWRQPIVAKPDGEVIAGNTRLKAAVQLGMTEVPVVRFEGSEIEATAFAIADNRTGEVAEWDEPALAQLLDELRKEDALDGVGFDPADIDELLQQLEEPEDEGNPDVDDPGPGEPPVQAVAQPGDLWTLGSHSLLCGDSTNLDDVKRVLDGDLANLVATDPPYLVDYTGDRPNDSGKDWSDRYREIDIKDASGFFTALFRNVLIETRRWRSRKWHADQGKRQPFAHAERPRHRLLVGRGLALIRSK